MELKREEEREGLFGRMMKYSRTDVVGEGFGKRKVGMRVRVKFYEHEEVEEGEYKWMKLVKVTTKEGTIVQITRRINGGYYDYWYKVQLNDGSCVWRSYVLLNSTNFKY